jgi:DNA-binding transcriptional LysR family regulator
VKSQGAINVGYLFSCRVAVNIKHLETFYWIVRLGSFSAAARKLNSTQPAISMRVRELESSLGAQLFDRTQRSVQLTPKAWELTKYAERMLALTAEIRACMGDDQLMSGRIRVGVTDSIALTWMPTLVSQINERYPAVILELDVDLTANLWHKFEGGKLELIMLPGPVHGSRMTADYLGGIRYCWMASPTLQLGGGKLAIKELERLPIISFAPESNLYELMENWFRGNDAEPHRVNLCNSLSVIASLTISGLGVSLLPPSVFSDQIAAGELRIIETLPPLPPIEFWVVHASRQVSPLPRLIAGLACEVSEFDRSVPGG